MSKQTRIEARDTTAAVNPDVEIQVLRSENAQLLRELENAYAQLTAVMQVSQDETRIAYSELQEKLVVLEKKLFEVELLADLGDALTAETDLHKLRHAIVDKICLALPVDLAALHLDADLREGTHRERDMVFDTWVEGDLLSRIRGSVDRIRERPQLLLIADLDQQPEYACLRLRPDARSAAAVPLRTSNFLGMLLLNSRLPSNFRQDQEPMLANYARQASQALQQALRLRRLEDMLVRVVHRHQIPVEGFRNTQQPTPEEPPFDRVREAIRRLLRED